MKTTHAALCLTSLVLAPLVLSTGAAAQDLLVANSNTDEILRFEAGTGAPAGTFASGGGLDHPVGMTFGPDGNLYVTSAGTDQVLRYHGTSGAFLGVFAEGGGLAGARHLNFGPRGDLYVASSGTDSILRYDGSDGTFIEEFTSGIAMDRTTSLTFGPDGNLYVSSPNTGDVMRFDGKTGDFIDSFADTDFLLLPQDPCFGPDGNLYVSNASSFISFVARFDGKTGEFIDLFVEDPDLLRAEGLTWGRDGHLYVANQGNWEIRRYDGVSGDLIDTFVPAGSGGLDSPWFLTFLPTEQEPTLAPPFPCLAGQENQLFVSGIRPGARTMLFSGRHETPFGVPGCGTLAILNPRLIASAMADESGHLLVRSPVPASAAGIPLLFQPLDAGRCLSGPLATHVFR